MDDHRDDLLPLLQVGRCERRAHLVKYILGPEAFRRCPSPLTASDATLAQYADHYWEYDSNKQVTKSTIRGGLLTYLYSFTDNTDTDDYNNWKRKATITRPDGALEIVYTNHIGQVLLKELREGSNKWIEYNVYGTEANSKPRCSWSTGILRRWPATWTMAAPAVRSWW